MAEHSYDGDPLDGTVQYVTERPALEEEADEVAYATDPEPEGEETTENVPLAGEDSGGCQFPGCAAAANQAYCSDCRAAMRGGEE